MIYFDNSATTKMFPEALATFVKVNEAIFGNPSSLNRLGTVANNLLQQSRKQISENLQVKPEEIFFTSGGTEGDNWIIKGTAMEKASFGRHIITSSVEHPAVTRSMKQLEKLGFEVTYLPVNKQGVISPTELEKEIRDDTILVSLIAVNNEVGVIQPLAEVGDILEAYPSIHYHVDAVQALTVFDSLMKHPRIDFFVLSAHKFNGPKGVGIVYKKEGKRIESLLTGGGQESGQRSTTENVAGVAATAKALRMSFEGNKKAKAHIKAIRDDITDYLDQFPDVEIYSTADGAPHIVCFALRDVRGEVMVHALEEHDIIISTTSACASKKGDLPATLSSMNVPAEWSRCAVRLSFSAENTQTEVEAFKQAFRQLHKKFQIIQS